MPKGHRITTELLQAIRETVRQVMGEYKNDENKRSRWFNKKPTWHLFGRATLAANLDNGIAVQATFKRWNSTTSAWVDYSPVFQQEVRCLFPITAAIPSGKVVFCVKFFGVWWVVAAEC